MTADRAKLERDLARVRDRVSKKKLELDALEDERDRLVIELRRLPDPPSLRALGRLAGISNVWVLKLEKRAG